MALSSQNFGGEYYSVKAEQRKRLDAWLHKNIPVGTKIRVLRTEPYSEFDTNLGNHQEKVLNQTLEITRFYAGGFDAVVLTGEHAGDDVTLLHGSDIFEVVKDDDYE